MFRRRLWFSRRPMPVWLLLVAGAAAPVQSVVVARGAPVGDQASPRLAAKAAELLAAELKAQGLSLMDPAEVERQRAGAAVLEVPDLGPARRALDEGKELYLKF